MPALNNRAAHLRAAKIPVLSWSANMVRWLRSWRAGKPAMPEADMQAHTGIPNILWALRAVSMLSAIPMIDAEFESITAAPFARPIIILAGNPLGIVRFVAP